MAEAHPGELRSAHIIEGMEADLRQRVDAHREATSMSPSLAIFSDNPFHTPSKRYIQYKEDAGYKLGIAVERVHIPPEYDIDRHVEYFQGVLEFACNQSGRNNGVIVQLPVVHEDQPGVTDKILERIPPHKDVDGLVSQEYFAPATPQAIVSLLEGHGIDYRDDPVVILGLGRLVGAPVKELLEKKGAKFIEGFDEHSDERVKAAAIDDARIIISATGQPGMLTPDLFSSMHPRVLIDAGTAEQDGAVRGDVSDELRQAALDNGWRITPRAGGVGPLTVHTLLANVVQAAEEQSQIAA